MKLSPSSCRFSAAVAKMAVLITLAGMNTIAQAADVHPGELVYKNACAACHDNPGTTLAPALPALKVMRAEALTFAITEGKMRVQAAGLSDQEKSDLVGYLGQGESNNWVAGMMCAADKQALDFSGEPIVKGFGYDLSNHRNLSAQQAGLKTADFKDLELAWTIAFPGAVTMRAQPVVVGNTLILPVADTAQVYAINTEGDPCVQWVYTNPVPLRTSAAFGYLEDKPVVVFGDGTATVHLLDAATGEKLWSQAVGVNPLSITTGTPVIHNNRVIVPVSQYEIVVASDTKHQCCTSHGAVRSLDLATGDIQWTYHTMEDAVPQRDRGDGVQLLGPSGAPIWNSPAIDIDREMIYFGTGEATSEPAHINTDAIIAIDLNTGEEKWSFQATADDIFVGSCAFAPGLNCPKKEDTVARDVDFGASMILATTEKGQDIVLAGQKSGTVWAVDRDSGEVLWRKDIGEGSPLGGIHWGIAYDGSQVFAPINRAFGFRPGPDADQSIEPGLYALNANTGELTWSYKTKKECDAERKQRAPICDTNFGFSAAPTVIDGAIVAGSLDGWLRVFNKDSGELLYQFDTAQAFPNAANGVEAKGGSMDAGSTVASNGMLFVQSGYGMFGQVPGNVLLAFKVK